MATKKMFRLTVAAPYYTRQRGKKKNRNSPFSSSFIVRGWFRTQREAKQAVDDFIDRAIGGRDNAIDKDKESFSKEEEPNVEIKPVSYDARYIDIEEEQNERIQH